MFLVNYQYFIKNIPMLPTRERTAKFPETTTPRSKLIESKPSKLIEHDNDLRSDYQLLNGVRKINSNFVIEQVVQLPEKNKEGMKRKLLKANTPTVKVEATGKTSSGKVVPEIPFGTYFLPYLANQRGSTKTASLILEPHSRAVVGNGGTAISVPISRAVLKRGIPTNVYFNPESVAIAGVGGKAHAQADLILDLMNRRR